MKVFEIFFLIGIGKIETLFRLDRNTGRKTFVFLAVFFQIQVDLRDRKTLITGFDVKLGSFKAQVVELIQNIRIDAIWKHLIVFRLDDQKPVGSAKQNIDNLKVFQSCRSFFVISVFCDDVFDVETHNCASFSSASFAAFFCACFLLDATP